MTEKKLVKALAGGQDMEKKAKFIKALYGDNRFGKGWEHTDLVYEYRGFEYIVTKDNNGYMGTPMRVQHEEAQREIDKRIEDAKKPIPKYDDSAERAFEEAWRYFEGETD